VVIRRRGAGRHGTVRAGNLRREILKILVGASIAVFSFGVGSSYAGDGDGYSATTLFTSIQNERAAAASTIVSQTPTGGARSSGAAVKADDTRGQGRGTLLFRVFALP
jgi:hypothetical protein